MLILDEATSALDVESETLVQDALDRLMAGRTTFIVAHRLSSLRCVQRVAVLKEGRLVELGSLAHLLKQPDGEFSRLQVQDSVCPAPSRATVRHWMDDASLSAVPGRSSY